MYDFLRPSHYNQFRGGYGTGAANGRIIAELETLRLATGFQPLVMQVPDISNAQVIARGTFDGRLTVLPGTRLWAVSGSSAEAAGAKVQVTDLGTKQALWPVPVDIRNCTGGTGATAEGMENRQWFLPRPMVFDRPGLIGVKIFNLATAANAIEILLWLQEPKWERPLLS
jgi:hypothetical protein